MNLNTVKNLCEYTNKMCSRNYSRLSRLFPYVKDFDTSKKDKSLSIAQQLMFDSGIISSRNRGLFILLPLGMRAINKLINIIHCHMENITAQHMALPSLTSANLWKLSGRLPDAGAEVMKFNDRHEHMFILSPTHEEVVTDLLSSVKPLMQSHLPIRLYQISTKFRDEMRYKNGLIRAKEFLMKDLYTFDSSEECALKTYADVLQIYDKLFKQLQLPVMRVKGSVGSIGGVKSHEYHIITDIGDDKIYQCIQCNEALNEEVIPNLENKRCISCNGNLEMKTGIEVAHTFFLGTRYSTPLSASFTTLQGKSFLQMGCYGIGVTRLLAAILEVMSTNEGLRWPISIVPYKVCIIPPKKGSKETKGNNWVEYLEKVIHCIPGFEHEIIVDDRVKLSIGRRLKDAKRTGYTYIVVIGKASQDNVPKFEVFDTYKNVNHLFTQAQLLYFLETCSQ